MNASKAVKSAVAEQFQLPTTLYFSYTHLVCRTAKDSRNKTICFLVFTLYVQMALVQEMILVIQFMQTTAY